MPGGVIVRQQRRLFIERIKSETPQLSHGLIVLAAMDHAALLDRFLKDDCVFQYDRIPQLPRGLDELPDVFR
jgi:hypothetical protein